jgi:uncharacterized YccA/Bax inhibitor family protein
LPASPSNQRGTAGSAQNYSRLVSTFGPDATVVTDRAPFVAADVLDKVGVLCVLAIVTGIGGAVLPLPPAVLVVAFLAAFGFSLAGLLRPATAHLFAPLYALCIGVALGGISRIYANGRGSVVPLAIVGTAAIFLAVLVLYRTGLVRVGPRFAQVTLITGFGVLAMAIAVSLGIPLPGTSSGSGSFILLFVAYLVFGVMGLFVDFNFVYMAEKAGVSKDGEWFAALSIMTSLVLIYLSLLRILGRR